MSDDPDLSALLKAAGDGITPQGSYEEIKERIMENDDKRRWVWPATAAAAVMVLVVGGLGWMLRDDDAPGAGPGPAGTPTVAATEDPTDTPTTTVVRKPVFYAGDSTLGKALFSEELSFPGTEDAGLTTVRAAMAGDATDPDYGSLWPTGIVARSVTYGPGPDGEDDRISVVLDGEDLESANGLDERERLLAVIAVVRTAQAAFGNDADVVFLDEDEQVISPLDAGGDAFAAGDDNTFLAPIQITSLTDGQTVPAGKVTVSGLASAFEANVLWELEDAGGSTIEENFTTARECCTLAPYSFDLDLAPGTYTIVVHDEDMSGENRPVNQDTKRIVVE